MAARAHDLHQQAEAIRHAADRLTLLRLRLARTLSESAASAASAESAGSPASAGSAAPAAPATGDEGRGAEEILERWTAEQYPQLGSVVGQLRRRAASLEDAARCSERSSGRRLGGYAGAGFLGRGDDAREHVTSVAQSIGASVLSGAEHGASIGGYPLEATPTEELALQDVSVELGAGDAPAEPAEPAEDAQER